MCYVCYCVDPSDQSEKHYPNGTKEIQFPNQTVKYIYPNGEDEIIFPNGSVRKLLPNGDCTIRLANGQEFQPKHDCAYWYTTIILILYLILYMNGITYQIVVQAPILKYSLRVFM